MKRLFKIEIDRIINSWGYVLSVVIGLILVFIQFFVVIIPESNNILSGFDGSFASYPKSIFITWFLFDDRHPYMFIFMIILPILATIPHGGSYHNDLKSGYIKNIYSRISRKKYLLVKYITTFVAGGMAVLIPLIISFLLTASVLPSLTPVMNGLFKLSGNRVMADLYFSKPYLYLFIYMCLYFIYAGVFATIALSASYVFNYLFFVLLTPFGIYYGLGVVSSYINNPVLKSFGPQCLLYLSQIRLVRMDVMILEPLILGVISFAFYWIRGNKDDIC